MPLQKENQNTEFKESWRDDWLEDICAFANTDGGKIYIGVYDNGDIKGLEDNNLRDLLVTLPNKVNNKLSIIPSVNEKNEGDLKYIEVIVAGSSVPISCNGKYFIRSGSTTLRLNGVQTMDFLQRKSGRTWDEILNIDFDINIISKTTIFKFANNAKDKLPSITAENDPKHILEKLYLVKSNKISNAGILLFGKELQKYFIHSKIKIGKFNTDADIEKQDILDRNLIRQVNDSLDVLTTKYLNRNIKYSADKIERIDELEYPIEALRESILNAIVHRDYSNTSDILIRVYTEKIVIMNPGTLPDELTIESLKSTHVSKPRNPYIADIFQKAGYIESWGRGTNKIIQACFNAGLPEPEFKNENGVFTITLFKDKYNEKYLMAFDLNIRQIDAVKYVKVHGKINNAQYRELNNIERRQATNDLSDLVQKQIFIKTGSGRGSYYKLNK